MTEIFQKAKKALAIKSVSLRNSFVALNEELDTSDVNNANGEIQTFRSVVKVKEISLQHDDKEIWEYHFFYACGIRVVNEDPEKEKNIDNETEEQNICVLAEIKATFDAIYRAEEKLEQALVEAFSDENVGYHVWPYWRELVQSSCARLNISALETPMYYCSPTS